MGSLCLCSTWCPVEIFIFLKLKTFFFFLLRAAPAAYGSSQARGQIRAASLTCTTAHGNAGPLTHRVRPGIEPASSGILVRFVATEPQWDPLKSLFLILTFFQFSCDIGHTLHCVKYNILILCVCVFQSDHCSKLGACPLPRVIDDFFFYLW